MITHDQIVQFSKRLITNEATVFREFSQLVFLKCLYSENFSEKVFFKGGTAIHIIFNAPRFSEDLDFTVGLRQSEFLKDISYVFNLVNQVLPVEFKERKTLAGKRYLMHVKPNIYPHSTFINLDFSFREKALDPQKSVIVTDFPVLFTDYCFHLSKDEIFAEKIRAIMTRSKSRDLYDLWYLLNIGVNVNNLIISKKLKYYDIKLESLNQIGSSIIKFSKKDFIEDLRPFVKLNEREKLGDLYGYIISYINDKLSKSSK